MSRKVVISTSRLNSYGFRVLTEGIDIKQFKKNPILLYSHFRPWRGTDDEIRPIGVVENLAIEGDSLVGELVFSQSYDFATKIEKQWDEGVYKMVSAGLTPVEFSDDPQYLLKGQTRSTLSKSILDEVSVVDIGANRDALALKNLSTGKMVQLNDNDLCFIPNINPKQDVTMKSVLLALGLEEDATEASALTALQVIMNRSKELGDENLSLKKEQEDALKLSIQRQVDEAIRLKKIAPEKKETYLTIGLKQGVDLLEQILSDMKPAAQLRPSSLGLSGSDGAVSLKWEDITDADRISLRATDPESYKAAFKQYYGFFPELD